MRTLLLERDARQCEAMARALRARGHGVIAHSDWAAVEALIAEQPIHIAMLDWGPAAERWVARSRSHANASRMLVVAILSPDDLDHLEQVFAAGANDFLLRPLDQPAHAYRLLQFEHRLYGWARLLEAHETAHNDYLRAAVEYSGDIVEITDSEMHLLYVNPSFTHVFGYSFTEALGRQPSELLRSGQHPVAFYQEIERTVAAGGVWRGEITSRAKDGRLVHLDATIVGVMDVTGEVVRHVAVKRDISARRLAEVSVRQARARLQATVSSLADAVISVDRDAVVLLANPAAQEIACVVDEHLIGRPVDEVLHLIDEDTELRVAHAVTDLVDPETGVTRIARFAAVDHRGLRHPVQPSVTPLRDEYGEDIGAVLVLRDMTQVRRVEEVLSAKAVAEAASHYKSLFLATVSHDLRTPMNGVMGMTALLEQTDLDNRQADLLATLRRSSEDLLTLIDELLDATRGELALLPEPDEEAVPVPVSDEQVSAPIGSGQPLVLVVDDNAINRKVARHMLATLNVRCQEARSGHEAVDLAAARAFDAIFMDCHMPGMSGLEATRLIRDHERGTGRHTLIIALTADGAYHDRTRCVNAGMDDYLSKPLRLGNLEAVLRTWRLLPAPQRQATEASEEVT